MSQERALQRTRGRGDWGRVPGGGAGLAWLEEADWAGAWAGTSHMGLRDAMGMSACSWVLCLFLHDWVSRFVCPNVCLHVYVCMEMFACPHLPVSTFVHVRVLPLPCLRGPILQFFVFYLFVHVSEFGRVPKRVWGMSLGLSVLLCVPVGCECVPLHVSLCGPVAPQLLSPAPCLCPSW